MTRRTSTRLPIIITEAAYSRAAIAAEMDGQSLAEFTEAALAVRVAQAVKRNRENRYADACREAIDNREMLMPKRHEFGLEEHRFKEQPFVRPAPEANGLRSAGRPSSRRHQDCRGAEARSKARSGTGAAQAKRGSEDPPFGVAEHSGTSHPLNYTQKPQN